MAWKIFSDANHTRADSHKMINFKQFLENYDVYYDKPMGFKKPDEADEIEQTSDEDTTQEENANEVRK